MSDFQQYTDEKQRVDDLIALGYRISKVNETLNGDEVEFRHSNPNLSDHPAIQLLIQTAEGRKYFATVLKSAGKLILRD